MTFQVITVVSICMFKSIVQNKTEIGDVQFGCAPDPLGKVCATVYAILLNQAVSRQKRFFSSTYLLHLITQACQVQISRVADNFAWISPRQTCKAYTSSLYLISSLSAHHREPRWLSCGVRTMRQSLHLVLFARAQNRCVVLVRLTRPSCLLLRLCLPTVRHSAFEFPHSDLA